MHLDQIIEGMMVPDSERIRALFTRDIEAKIALVDVMSETIAKAGLRLVNCLLADGKIFICGAGGSMANCSHFVTAMHNGFEVERPSLPVVSLSSDVSALTGIASEGHFEHVFARQIQALGQEKDVLIMVTTSGQSPAMVQAVKMARIRGMDTIALTAREGGVLANHFAPSDIELRIPGTSSAQIREIHLFILHCFSDHIDRALFGTYDTQ